MLSHVCCRCNVIQACALQPVLSVLWACCSCHMRIWALPWVCMMEPLCKEPAVNRHHTAMARCNAVQSTKHDRRKCSVCWDRGRRQRRHNSHDRVWRNLRTHQGSFELLHDDLALIGTTD